MLARVVVVSTAIALASCARGSSGALAGTYYGFTEFATSTSSSTGRVSTATIADGSTADLVIELHIPRIFQDDAICHVEGNLHGAMQADLLPGQHCQIGALSFAVTSGTIVMDVDFHLVAIVEGESTDSRGVVSPAQIRFEGDG